MKYGCDIIYGVSWT